MLWGQVLVQFLALPLYWVKPRLSYFTSQGLSFSSVNWGKITLSSYNYCKVEVDNEHKGFYAQHTNTQPKHPFSLPLHLLPPSTCPNSTSASPLFHCCMCISTPIYITFPETDFRACVKNLHRY